MRKVRGLSPVAVIVVTGGLLLFIWRSPHRNDLESFGSTAAAIVAVSLTLIISAGTGRAGSKDRGRALDDVADLLAGVVKGQWTEAAAQRWLLHPEPIPVRWERSSKPIAAPVSAAVDSDQFPPLPGLPPAGQEQLRNGGLQDLHAVYGGLGSGRLVIVGAPGSGKSGAAVLLILAALKYRERLPIKQRPAVPVPVMFTFAGWDPSVQPVDDWLATRLRQTYPLFPGRGGATNAAALVRAGKIAVILDGLDEIPAELRPVALRALSQQAVFRVVVLGRSLEMAAAARSALLEDAVALELQDVDPSASADYLTRVQLDPAPPGWRELTGRLRNASNRPIAKALSSPLTLTLIRDTYRGGDDVRELLDFCDAAGEGVSREDIEDHLLDRVLPAAYRPRPGEPPPRYGLPAAQHALEYVAERMNKDAMRDLAWWRIPTWTSAAPRIIATGLVFGLIFALGGGLALGLVAAPVSSLLYVLGRRGKSPLRIAPLRWHELFSRSSLVVGLGFGLVGGLFGVLVFGLVFGLAIGRLVGLVGGLVAGLAGALATGLSRPGADSASPLSPSASWRSDQTFGLALGLALGLVLGLVLGLALGRLVGLVIGFVDGLVYGLVYGLVFPETWTASLAFAQLARHRHTPVRLMRFLEDARKRGVLRTVGPVYQFRHARLQDRLADQAKLAYPEQQGIGTNP